MRNINQYPLNAQDIFNVIENAQKTAIEKRLVGGMDLMVYAQLLNFLKNEENMKALLEFKN